MKRSFALWGFLSAALGCRANAPVEPPVCPAEDPSCAPKVEIPPYEGDHALDAVVHPVFYLAEHTPQPEATATLCRRMYADLIGRYPSKAEVDATCEGKTPGQIVDTLMAEPGYLLIAERHWRDRLDTSDATVDWRYLKSLYEVVNQLHTGQLGYADFAIEVLSHPGFMLSEVFAEDRARAAFSAFMGRNASDAEAIDLAGLVRFWIPQAESDPDFDYIFRQGAFVLPYLCEPLFQCKATLFGGGEVNLNGSVQDFLPYETLLSWQKKEIGELGRLFVRQPMFWEAAADDILNRYLGWSDGGRFPREPGIVLPQLRDRLATMLKETGDYRGAEKLVLTSWLYTQRANVEATQDDPVYLSGPIKAASAEVWLDSALEIAFPLGTCDTRYPDAVAYTQIQAALTMTSTTMPDFQMIASEFMRLHALQESRLRVRFDETIQAEIPDFQYLSVARLLGGCPGFQAGRGAPIGMSYAYTQESFAELLCQPEVALGAVAPTRTLPGIVAHQMERLFSKSPTEEDVADFEAALTECQQGPACTSFEGMTNSVCVALLGSAQMLFY